MRRTSDRQMGLLNIAVDIRSRLEDVPMATFEGMQKWTNEIMKGEVQLAKSRVGVKTGRTKASIRLKYEAKERHPTAVVIYKSWLPAWINSGGSRRYAETIKRIQEHYRSLGINLTRKEVRRAYSMRSFGKRMKKVHPTYWSYRPLKQLVGKTKSRTLMEQHLRASMSRIRVE